MYEVMLVVRPSFLVLKTGGLAQLARAPALQAGGRRFDSDILHGAESEKLKAESRKQKAKTSQ
jgi:hypothetical protein